MQLYPTQDYVLVEILDREYTSEAGLILPEHRKKTFKGKIVAIAEGLRDKNGDKLPIDPDIQIGRTVWFDRFLGTDFEIDGKKIRFIKPDQIVCYLDEGEPQDETIRADLDAFSDPHSHIPPDAEQVSRETQSFFIQGSANESANKDAAANRH